MKYLVVCEEWEYNDEYYSTTEEESYTITSKLYSTKEEAQKETDTLNETRGWDGYFRDPDSGWETVEGTIKPYKVVPVEE